MLPSIDDLWQTLMLQSLLRFQFCYCRVSPQLWMQEHLTLGCRLMQCSGPTTSPQNRVEWGLDQKHKKPAIFPKQCKVGVGPRLLWRTNRKSHTPFRLLPKSMTLDDFERPKRYPCRQWRSQKFVMEGVQNRGLRGAGDGASGRGVSLRDTLSTDPTPSPSQKIFDIWS